MCACSASLLVIYFAGWQGESAKVVFGLALLFLTVGAVARQ